MADRKRYDIISGARSPALAKLMADRETAALRLASVAGRRVDDLMDEVTRREILFDHHRRTHPTGARDATLAALESVRNDVTHGWL